MIIIIIMSFMVTLNSKPRTELNSKTVSFFFVVICIHKTLQKSFENRLLAVSFTHCLFAISFYFFIDPEFYRHPPVIQKDEFNVLLHKKLENTKKEGETGCFRLFCCSVMSNDQ